MEKQELLQLKNSLLSLTVFRRLLKDPILSALYNYLSALETEETVKAVSAYSEFVGKLYEANAGNLSKYIEQLCFSSENVYVKILGSKKTPQDYITCSVEHELNTFEHISMLTSKQLLEPLKWDGFLPSFQTENTNLLENYKQRANNIGKYGYGKYASNHMFCISDDGDILPVNNPDKIRLTSLIDYEKQRRLIIENTKALLNEKPAANILLTGDAGTGKSSTVKAVANEFYSEGLRIVEIRKDQLRFIPKILNELASNPLKFILFIDDLSFLSDDDNFNELKAVLDGSISARSQNTAIYATSNRRHIIKERFSDRDCDEVHRNDTMQEMISLSDRFGLHITFEKPSKQTYLNIVKQLAQQNSICMDDDELVLQAERFALERGGRSARLARQFIDHLLSQED